MNSLENQDILVGCKNLVVYQTFQILYSYRENIFLHQNHKMVLHPRLKDLISIPHHRISFIYKKYIILVIYRNIIKIMGLIPKSELQQINSTAIVEEQQINNADLEEQTNYLFCMLSLYVKATIDMLIYHENDESKLFFLNLSLTTNCINIINEVGQVTDTYDMCDVVANKILENKESMKEEIIEGLKVFAGLILRMARNILNAEIYYSAILEKTFEFDVHVSGDDQKQIKYKKNKVKTAIFIVRLLHPYFLENNEFIKSISDKIDNNPMSDVIEEEEIEIKYQLYDVDYDDVIGDLVVKKLIDME